MEHTPIKMNKNKGIAPSESESLRYKWDKEELEKIATIAMKTAIDSYTKSITRMINKEAKKCIKNIAVNVELNYK